MLRCYFVARFSYFLDSFDLFFIHCAQLEAEWRSRSRGALLKGYAAPCCWIKNSFSTCCRKSAHTSVHSELMGGIVCVCCFVNCNEEDEFTHRCQGWFVNCIFFSVSVCVRVCVVEIYWTNYCCVVQIFIIITPVWKHMSILTFNIAAVERMHVSQMSLNDSAVGMLWWSRAHCGPEYLMKC